MISSGINAKELRGKLAGVQHSRKKIPISLGWQLNRDRGRGRCLDRRPSAQVYSRQWSPAAQSTASAASATKEV
jgi:hypothetical protein